MSIDIPEFDPLYASTAGQGAAARSGAVQKDTATAAPANAAGAAAGPNAFIEKLAARYPGASFSIGGGFEADSAALAKLGRANVMIDEKMAQRLVQQPELADKYQSAIDKLLNSFDRLFEQAGGVSRDIIAWGTFISSMGAFNSWGVTSPFSNTAGAFQFFDQNLMRSLLAFEESEAARLIEDEAEMVKYEQSLEEAEEAIRHQQQLNPHIQNKAAQPVAPAAQKELFSAGIEKEAPHRLDVED